VNPPPAKRKRATPPLDPWGPEELAEFLRKTAATLFRVGDLETKKDGSFVFWALLPEEASDETVVRMARVTVTSAMNVTVAVRGAEGKKIETLLQENLQFAAAKRSP
jgi:hypothetical protein